ncbi:hypothetical protein WOLCODRAFT_76327, partial [Wolfiporia cocos MD-104 SS10]
DLHAAYSKLLYTLFPTDTDFTVVPQHTPELHEESTGHEVTGFLVVLEVSLENRPVLILELKPPRDLQYVSSREAADREKFNIASAI